MKRRVLTVALAILLAVVGTAGVVAYVRQADARAIAGMRAVTVLVAHQEIPSGTSANTALQDSLLISQRLPASSVPPDAVSSITPSLGGLVMSANVQPGQLLLRPMLVTAAQVTGGIAIPRGMVAVTIAFCVPEAVAGNVHAGSEVAVFDTFAPRAQSLNAQSDCSGQHQQQAFGQVHTQMVLPKVEVLSVGTASQTGAGGGTATGSSTSSTSSNSSGQSTLLTLAVNQADAERLIQLSATGLPYLALLTSSSQTRLDSRPLPLIQP